MPSITTWYRVEPRARSADLSEAIAARVHDPLWLLCRQWQLGEFAGHDGGLPVSATVTAVTTPLDRYALGAGPDVPYDGTVPLEAIIEREAVRPARPPATFAKRPKPVCTSRACSRTQA